AGTLKQIQKVIKAQKKPNPLFASYDGKIVATGLNIGMEPDLKPSNSFSFNNKSLGNLSTDGSQVFLDDFPIDPLGDNPAENSNKTAVRVRNLVTKRSIDGAKLYHYFKNGGMPEDFGFPGLNDQVEPFMQWVSNTYYTRSAEHTSELQSRENL